MIQWLRNAWTTAVLGGALAVGPAAAADDEAVKRDLSAVLALQGRPCGEVVSVTRRADNDYIVTCGNGSRYRVFLSPQGRVVVEAR